jgi:hypothetical protein
MRETIKPNPAKESFLILFIKAVDILKQIGNTAKIPACLKKKRNAPLAVDISRK